MKFLVIDNLLSADRCRELIELSEAKGYDEADISFKEGAQMNKEYRNNSRCLYRDEELRLELEKLIEPHAPKVYPFFAKAQLQEANFLRLSGNFRFYRYREGEEFKKHRDGNINEEGGLSRITVLLYLNDVAAEHGGETDMCDRMLDRPELITPVTGRMLLFDHDLVHAGKALTGGSKYLLRTDLIYDK